MKPTLPQRTQKCSSAPSWKSTALPSHAPRRSCQLTAQPCLRRRAASTQGGGNTSVPCSTDPPLWTPVCSTRCRRSPSSPASTSPQRSMKCRMQSDRPVRENPLGWTGFLQRSSSQPVQWPSKHSTHSSPASGKKRMSRKIQECHIRLTVQEQGSKTECGNFRGISLRSVTGKILDRVILNHLITNISEENLREAQCGFRPNHSTTDMIFSVRLVQGNCIEQNNYGPRCRSTRSTERPFG